MRIEGSNSALTNLRNAPRVGAGTAAPVGTPRKTLGETPPVVVPWELLGDLEELFAPGGIVSRLRRRLNRLKHKRCRVVPARGTIACIDANDLVYLGVDFLSENRRREEVIAGVMAHEWGHACALKPGEGDLQAMGWDEIFELRRAHETLADEISGRLLALMGYRPEAFIAFLQRDGRRPTNLKYHDSAIRSSVIRRGYAEERRKMEFARQIFPAKTYGNHYNTLVIDDEI